MKKSTLLVAALAFGATSAFAQYTNKNGLVVTPEAGDYAIGVDASPFLSYFGNMLNGNTNNASPAWNFTNGNAMITGKMFTSETMAYRAALRIGFNSSTQKAMIQQDGATATYPNLPAMVEDQMKESSRYIGLGGGLEWRRGKNRLQGYWGGMAMIWMAGGKSTYEYGNALTTTNSVGGITTDFGSNITVDAYGNAARVTEMKQSSMFGVGVRGFVGAEYFILPKLSIGGEFGWGIGFATMGASTTTMESVGGSPATVGTMTIEGDKGSGLSIDTDNAAFGLAPAALLIHWHF